LVYLTRIQAYTQWRINEGTIRDIAHGAGKMLTLQKICVEKQTDDGKGIDTEEN